MQFEPDFSYGGFRYSLLTFTCGENDIRDIAASDVAAAVNPTIVPGMIVSHFTHTDLGHTGTVDFNLDLLNRIQRMTRYTSFSNLMDMPTDCPTRERQGWTGDGQLTSPVVSYNFDAGAFYRKWLRDIGDAQRFFRSECMGTGPPPDDCDCKFDDCAGEIPPAAPWYRHGYHGGKGGRAGNLTMPGTDPAWGMAYTVIAHYMLDWYGDLRAVEEQYAGLVLYMQYLRNIPGVDPVVAPFSQTDLLTYNVYADWDKPSGMRDKNPPVPPSSIVPKPSNGPRGQPSPLIGSWSYITQLRQMTEIAEALGHSDDATRFAADATRSSKAFIAAYFRGAGTPGATFGDGALTQMSANALALDLFPEDAEVAVGLNPGQREATVNALVRAVVATGDHSDAGIISFSTLYPVMSSVTAPKGSALPGTLALAINVKQDYPSFGYELTRNATTLWEKFEGTGGTHNHIMFGTQSAWYVWLPRLLDPL
jgi:alpha-L-rhamnosidase